MRNKLLIRDFFVSLAALNERDLTSLFPTGKKLSLCLTNCALRHDDVSVEGCKLLDRRFLDLRTSWRLMVSFTSRQLYLRYPSIGDWICPQRRSARYGEVNILDTTGARTATLP
jgi:hypothetical protein